MIMNILCKITYFLEFWTNTGTVMKVSGSPKSTGFLLRIKIMKTERNERSSFTDIKIEGLVNDGVTKVIRKQALARGKVEGSFIKGVCTNSNFMGARSFLYCVSLCCTEFLST